jgi:uncharacterized protein
MQFTRESATEANTILACTNEEVRLRDRVVRGCVIVTRDTVIDHWRPADPESLTIEDFECLLALAPDVVLLGTGDRQRMQPPALYAAFASRGIGLEVMDNRAACRTFNLLLGEFRNVTVALML